MRPPRLVLALLAGSALAASCSLSSPKASPSEPPSLESPPSSPADGTGVEDPLVALVEGVRPSVVNVSTQAVVNTVFGPRRVKGVGTGFIIRPNGIIVTNYHVVENAESIEVTTPPPDAESYPARVIGGEATKDLAVLKIEAAGLPVAVLDVSDDVKLGEPVVALGYALGLKGGPTVTSGIVSALSRTIHVRDPGCDDCKHHSRTYEGVIQTDAAINPGNSGGPLLNMDGEVVGINTAGATASENIGFSIAIDAAAPIIESAIAEPSAPKAYLGIVADDVTPGAAVQYDLPVKEGARVISVSPQGPSGTAGVSKGEVIVAFDGEPVVDAAGLRALLLEHEPGDQVQVELAVDGGGTREVSVTLGVDPIS